MRFLKNIFVRTLMIVLLGAAVKYGVIDRPNLAPKIKAAVVKDAEHLKGAEK